MERQHRFATVVAVLAVLSLAWLQFDVTRAAFELLGLSNSGALALVMGCLVGSTVDIPVGRLRETGTLVAVNVGGCVIPVLMAGWVVSHARLGIGEVVAATAGVALASWRFSRVEPGVGVTMRGFVAPLAALVAAAVVDRGALAPLAYVSGAVGVLLGADLMRLREAAQGGALALSLGGAGTRDGIFLAGVIAVLIA